MLQANVIVYFKEILMNIQAYFSKSNLIGIITFELLDSIKNQLFTRLEKANLLKLVRIVDNGIINIGF